MSKKMELIVHIFKKIKNSLTYQNFVLFIVFLFFFMQGFVLSYATEDEESSIYKKNNKLVTHYGFSDPLVQSFCVGFSRSILEVAVELPFDGMITRMQAYNTTSIQTFNNILKKKEITRFYQGAVPKFMSSLARNTYVWPLLTAMPKLYGGLLPEVCEEKYSFVKKVLTAMTIAGADAFIVTPFERWKVMMMTRSHEERSIYKTLKSSSNGLIFELFRGVNTVYQGSLYSWLIYLVSDHELRKYAKRKDPEGKLTFTSLLMVSGTLSIIDAGVWLPFQMVKTQFQKDNPFPPQNTLKTMFYLARTKGVSSLYTGWRLELPRTMIMTLFNTYFYNQLDSN